MIRASPLPNTPDRTLPRVAANSSGIIIRLFSQTILLVLIFASCSSATSPVGGTSITLRIRETNGTIKQVTHDGIPSNNDTTLQELLQMNPSEESIVNARGEKLDPSKSISELNLSHGSLLSILPNKTKLQQRAPTTTTTEVDHFDPFPSMAKRSFTQASRLARARSQNRRGMSFSDVDKISSSMHKVESQEEGAVKRIYVCSKSAERFQLGCGTKKGEIKNRVGLLFGSVSKERLEKRGRVTRTSLSTSTTDPMCDVVKVQAIWEPPQKSLEGGRYNPDKMVRFAADPAVSRALELGKKLGLQPVGWIFSYSPKEREDKSEIPILGGDVLVGSQLQIQNMQRCGEKKGQAFVMLCLDAELGATEAFQISNVAVQMVAEGVLGGGKFNFMGVDGEVRSIPTSEPVIVDEKEVREVDSVLCLVNTGLLGHVGKLSGERILGKKGVITTKNKKQILSQLEKGADLQLFCDFDLLYALDKLVGDKDMDDLCDLVVKWSKGQKKGTVLTPNLCLVLQSSLGG